MAKVIVFQGGRVAESHHSDGNRRLYFHSKIPVEFVCLENSKQFHGSETSWPCEDCRHQNKITQDFHFIRNLNISCYFSGKVWVKNKIKSEDCNIPGFKEKFQVLTSFAKQPSTVNWHLASAKVGTWEILWSYMSFQVPLSHLCLNKHFLANSPHFVWWWEKHMRSRTSSAVSFHMTWRGTNNFQLVIFTLMLFLSSYLDRA